MAELPKINILFEDNHLLVVEKPINSQMAGGTFMKNRFVYAFVTFLVITGIIVTCCDIATTHKNSTENDAGITVANVGNQPAETPEVTTKPTETPEATTKPTETPEATTNPTETPEATTNPTETPETQIKFTSEYISEDGFMPYALYTPSTINEDVETPLIVWLHGSGEVGVGKDTFFNSGLLKVMNKWRRQGFNAYVLCPQLAGNYNTGRWNKESTKDNLRSLIDKFIAEHNLWITITRFDMRHDGFVDIPFNRFKIVG